MACMKLGSKSEPFHLDGQSWHCPSGLASDVTIQIGEIFFHLHKFPLMSRSGLLEKLIAESNKEDGSVCVLQLSEIPGGAKAFELVAKFCYGIKMELTALNVVILRCAAEYLQMNDDYGDGNLIAQTEVFLNIIFGSWSDTIRALETFEEVLPQAEELHIVSKCINSLATKACADPKLFTDPASGTGSDNDREGTDRTWNGIATANRGPGGSDGWWYKDISFLSLPLYKRLMLTVEAAGMSPENLAGSIVFYARKFIPLMNRQSSFNDANPSKQGTNSSPSEADQRALLEEIVELLPNQRRVTQTKFLIRLLRTAMVLQTSPSCRENLEKRVGLQLDQATVDDLLIPNMGYSVETLYDVDCFQRILDHFLSMEQSMASSPCIVEENQQMVEAGPHSLSGMTRVADLVDSYLTDVATDVNLKFPKFQSIAAAIPDYARPLADGIYRAIDIYLKAHPWLTDAEREQICRLMNCEKTSLEASTHAAQNERLPLRVIVQVLFFEQLRLRTSISGWFFVSENLENSQNPSGVLSMGKNGGRGKGMDDMKYRVTELEKECSSMKQEFHTVLKSKKNLEHILEKKVQRGNSKLCKLT